MCWESQNVQLNNLADAPKVPMKCGRKLRIPMRHDRPAINISTGKEGKTDEAY
jgi:hypothetical protein